jgi:spore maturation protein CgeB
MKILITGGDYTWSIERFYLRHLNDFTDVSAELFPAQNLLYSYLGSNIFNKVKHRLGITSIYQKINSRFKVKVEEFKPDFIWVFKGMEIAPESLSWAKSRGIKLINYNPDNPFIFTGRGSGNKNVKNSLELFDLHYTYSLDILEQLQERKNFISKLLPFAYELPEDISGKNLQEVIEINKVCFVGNPDHTRAEFVQELVNDGVLIDLYGNNWDKFVKHENVNMLPPIYGNDLWITLRKYRVQLNMLRIHNLTSHNMRTFEIPGVGGIQLAPYTKEHSLFFDDQKEIFMYKDAPDAVSQINSLLNMNTDEARHIRKDAMVKCESKGYTYKARSKEVYDMLAQL